MKEPKIIAYLRIKNEERWIKNCLTSLSNFCYGFVIVDDGSTDNTVKICEQFPKTLEILKQSGLPFDEIRDRKNSLKMALRHDPEFVLSVDGDEIFQPNTRDILFNELNVLYSQYSVFEFQSLTMWDKSNQYRYDGTFSNKWLRILLRLRDQSDELFFHDPKLSKVAHGTRLPDNSIGLTNSIRSKVKILHYGYYDEPLRMKNYNFYLSNDDLSERFDNYQHTISGKGKFSGKNGIRTKLLPKSLTSDL